MAGAEVQHEGRRAEGNGEVIGHLGAEQVLVKGLRPPEEIHPQRHRAAGGGPEIGRNSCTSSGSDGSARRVWKSIIDFVRY